jgi:hypothetical protein
MSRPLPRAGSGPKADAAFPHRPGSTWASAGWWRLGHLGVDPLGYAGVGGCDQVEVAPPGIAVVRDGRAAGAPLARSERAMRSVLLRATMGSSSPWTISAGARSRSAAGSLAARTESRR